VKNWTIRDDQFQLLLFLGGLCNVTDAGKSGNRADQKIFCPQVGPERTDLPIVFRETQVGCTQWLDQLLRLSRGTG
jgi:hypothetical protein